MNDDYKNEQNANALMDAAMSSDGRLFGVKVPEPFPSIWGVFGTDAMRLASEHGGKAVGTAVSKITRSDAAGRTAEKVVGYGVPYIEQGIKTLTITKTHNKNRAVVLDPIKPLLDANKNATNTGMLGSIKGHFDNGHSGNKMVEFALGKVTEDTYQSLKMLAVGASSAILNNTSTYLTNLEDRTEKQEKTRQFISDWGGKIAGAAALGVQKTLKNIDINEALDDTSYGKVRALQESIRINNLDSPNNVATSSDLASVASQVEDIFQTYQKEQKLGQIPSHRMREVSNQIAEELVSGDLHALSLINLIGKEKLLNEKKDGLVSSEKISELLKAETTVFSKNSAITSEDYLKDHSNFTLDDVRSHLASKDQDERALAAVLVPESVAIEAGLKKDDVKNLKSHFSKKMQEGVFTAVVKGLASQTDDQLEDKGLSREAVVFVRDHEGAGAESIAHAMQSKAGTQQLQNLSAGELFGEESTAWRDVIAQGKAAVVTGKGPVANDEKFLLAANGGHAAKVRATKDNVAAAK